MLWASEDHVQRLKQYSLDDYRRLLHVLLCILYFLIFVKLDICSKISSCMDPCSVITQIRQPSYRLDSAICRWGSSILAKGQAALTEIHVNAGGVTSGHWPTVTPASYKCLSHACPFVALCWWKLEVFLKGRWIFFLLCSSAYWHCWSFHLCCQRSILRAELLRKRRGESVRFTGSWLMIQLCCHGHWIFCYVVLLLRLLCPVKMFMYYIRNSILKAFFESVFVFTNISNLLHPYMDVKVLFRNHKKNQHNF